MPNVPTIIFRSKNYLNFISFMWTNVVSLNGNEFTLRLDIERNTCFNFRKIKAFKKLEKIYECLVGKSQYVLDKSGNVSDYLSDDQSCLK